MSNTHRHQFDDDDGYQTIANVCGICKVLTRWCNCDSDQPSSDRSRNHVRSSN